MRTLDNLNEVQKKQYALMDEKLSQGWCFFDANRIFF
jgi:hypothetical protein